MINTIKKILIKNKPKNSFDGIVLKNVSKKYETELGFKEILKNVSIKIPYGKNIGILGVNGAGKSTLLRMLGKIDFPTKGKISSNHSFSWVMGLSGGFQGSLTGRDNVKFVCRIHGLSEEEIKQKIDFILDFTELGKDFELPVKTYSNGMKSKLGFAMSLSIEFDYYLIDETISVGDVFFKNKCVNAVNELRKKSNFIVVSHDMKVLKEMCDVGILLHNQELILYDSVDEAVENYMKLGK